MTKTCTKCQAQFETADETKTLCPACAAEQNPVEGEVKAEEPKTEGAPTA